MKLKENGYKDWPEKYLLILSRRSLTMYGVKIKNIEEVYNKSKRFLALKNFLDVVIANQFEADIQLGAHDSIKVKAILLVPMLQDEIYKLGTDLKELGVDLEGS